MYKNALTRIRRECKNDYYNKTLEDNKNNTKGKLNILKVFLEINKPKLITQTISKNMVITNRNKVINRFNEFSVSVVKSSQGNKKYTA